ncbi:hypothetical protein AU106_gp190 [Sinorhizobium phage phiM9]|uniref:Uncharacterized protein n=1 Tax=Sinorhizobium phage phiM9 TaxID=1636182 RepID=A0A0F6TH98_9CAUD|nr:hypothetical protein AU106_gp190 [Sinorhizobium phage phiM9]AKE44821.1 hypothetical protein Sm_phiM9_194 [Sinorhizobium phage phiM9]
MIYSKKAAIRLIEANLEMIENVPFDLDRPHTLAKVLRAYGLIEEGAYDQYLEEYILRGMCEDSAVRSEAECIYDQLMRYGFMYVVEDQEGDED